MYVAYQRNHRYYIHYRLIGAIDVISVCVKNVLASCSDSTYANKRDSPKGKPRLFYVNFCVKIRILVLNIKIAKSETIIK